MIGVRLAPPPVEAVPETQPVEGSHLLQAVPAVALAGALAFVGFLGATLLWQQPLAPVNELTLAGTVNVIPEHDISLYVFFGAVSLALIAVAGLVGGRRSMPGSAAARAGGAVAGAAGAVLVAIVMFNNSRYRIENGPRIRGSELAVFILLAAGLAAGTWLLRPTAAPAPAPAVPSRLRFRPADVIFPVLVVLVLYLPGWRRLAGNAFSGEELLHIDYFAMGQAVAFDKGVALGSGMHPYYGMGWALLLSKMPLIGDLSYGRFIRLEVVYGCIYFVGVYAFLRLLTRRWQWAVAGTTLAVLLQLFASYSDAFVMWRFPSATVLRWMFDIWFFLACLAYLRTKKDGWLVAGGLILGLALLFQTDTGMYLGVAAAFFWLCLWRLEPGSGRRLLRTAAVAGGGGFAILFAGLGVASRWTLFDQAFWEGWLENLRLTRAGATLLPILGLSGPRVMFFFALMMITYLAIAGYAVVQFAHRRLTPDAILLGTIALYGFFTLLYFVGRSNPHNLFRPAVPFAILLAGAAGLARPPAIVPRAAVRGAPWAAAALAVVMLVAHPGFHTYPGLLKTAIVGSEAKGLCVFGSADVCDIEPDNPDYAGPDVAAYSQQLEDLAAHLRTIARPTDQVAILDSMGPLVFIMADVRPWGRYVPTLPGLFLRSMVATVVSDLQSSPPDIVVMRSRELRQPFYDDMWHAMRPTVELGYTLDTTFGPLEVWQRQVAGVASGRGGNN